MGPQFYSKDEVDRRLADLLKSGQLIYPAKDIRAGFFNTDAAIHDMLHWSMAQYLVELSSEYNNTEIRTLWLTGPRMIIPYIQGYDGNQTIFKNTMESRTYGTK